MNITQVKMRKIADIDKKTKGIKHLLFLNPTGDEFEQFEQFLYCLYFQFNFEDLKNNLKYYRHTFLVFRSKEMTLRQQQNNLIEIGSLPSY